MSFGVKEVMQWRQAAATGKGFLGLQQRHLCCKGNSLRERNAVAFSSDQFQDGKTWRQRELTTSVVGETAIIEKSKYPCGNML